MSKSGRNLPEFRSVQLEFADHIRNPDMYPVPADVDPRRMKIYSDLFFNNIMSFLDSAYPIARQIVGEDAWRVLAREFFHRHPSESPYFLQISEEFLTFLHGRGLHDLPGFLLELCHYEWVELSLDVANDATDLVPYDSQRALTGEIVCSPLTRSLVYTFPVHQIGVSHQPKTQPEQATYLLVYRNAGLQVRFMESNPVTHRLLELLHLMSVEETLQALRCELNEAGRDISEAQMRTQGMQILSHLRDLGIVLGARTN